MTDRDALAAGRRAVVAAGVGNVGLARYLGSAAVTWRRSDRLGVHAEVTWRPLREQVAHVLVTRDAGGTAAYRL